jgi:PHYB activation tagged suppressor 1
LITRISTQVIKDRIADGVYGDDLLGMMLKAHMSEDKMLSIEEIIGECKTFFAAGQDTGANLLTWAMFLVSSYPQWQEKLREEVRREYRDAPISDNLGKLKLVCAQITYAYNTYKYKFTYVFAHTNAA